MSAAPSIRAVLPLLIGLAIGGVGAVLFMQSQPGAAGTPEARANQLEVDLKHARNQIADLEARVPGSSRAKHTISDGMRSIVDDIRAGRPVTPDDIFRRCQPLLADLSPLFERMRIREGERRADSLAGELTRKYDLTPAQQIALKDWFKQKATNDAKDWTDLVGRPGTSLEDIMKESRNVRPDVGLDGFMDKTLTGDKLAEFKTERAAEKAERIQQDADMRVERLDSIVKLDDSQRDQVFNIMARNSPDYDSSMKLEGGAGDLGAAPAGSREEATLSVLRPDQREAYAAEKQQRRESAEKDLQSIGLTLPTTWDALDQ